MAKHQAFGGARERESRPAVSAYNPASCTSYGIVVHEYTVRRRRSVRTGVAAVEAPGVLPEQAYVRVEHVLRRLIWMFQSLVPRLGIRGRDLALANPTPCRYTEKHSLGEIAPWSTWLSISRKK